MNFEEIKDQIPYYLTRPAADGLLKELESYSEKTQLFASSSFEGVLQGDGWKGFTLFDFGRKTAITSRAIVLSNSCDIDPNNKREIPAKVTFVPLIRLSRVKSVFENCLSNSQSVDEKIKAIKEQRSTSFFYLPSQGVLEEDYVAWFNDIHSMPMSTFLENQEKTKLFSLNMTGFYLFLFKLSIHFCRFHEKVDRG